RSTSNRNGSTSAMPAALSRAAASRPFASSRLPRTTAMPSSPSPRAVSKPIPLFAPVMNATLSCLAMVVLLSPAAAVSVRDPAGRSPIRFDRPGRYERSGGRGVPAPPPRAAKEVGSDLGHPAVDEQLDARDVAAVVGGEEQGDVRDLLGGAHPPQRH